ncbi:ACP S-malonyltransferase [Kitasatospora sp. LaBMicrA B282]|uniref:ACP S-malonyltransferase n=1 Tax=Kitasatospora sp. LaBMicrA B282 TaxID=3420949 RepID=UPI003D112B50
MTTDQPTAAPTALVFPGMAPTRFADVGEFLLFDPYGRRRRQEADRALGHSVLDEYRTCAEDYGAAAQVAYLTVCLALADRAEAELGVAPELCAGPSFGQRAAAAYAGSLPFADAVRLTAELARCEEEYFATEHRDMVTLTFLRTPEEKLRELLAELDELGEPHGISGHLDEGFHLLTLREPALDRFRSRVSELGGYSLYTMRPPVHAPAFGELRRRAEEQVFARYTVEAPRLPVVADQDGSIVTTAEAMRTMLLDTFDRPIHWPKMVTTLHEHGIRRLCLAGPENLFARLDCTREGFELLNVTPKSAI